MRCCIVGFLIVDVVWLADVYKSFGWAQEEKREGLPVSQLKKKMYSVFI